MTLLPSFSLEELEGFAVTSQVSDPNCKDLMAATTNSDNMMVVAATDSNSDSNSYCNWKDLPADLLYRILKFLRLTDNIRFGAVCTDWYSVADHNLYPLPPQPPFLLLAGDKTASSDLFQFFDLSTKKFYNMRLPQLLKRRCIGSSEGKLIYIDERAELHVLDPITGSHFDLPSITTFPGIGDPALDIDGNVSSYLYQSFVCDPSHPWYEDPYYEDVDYFMKAYFFKVIICPKTSAVVVLRHYEDCLAICMPGDRSWTMIDNGPLRSQGVEILRFMDAVFYKDGLYGVTYYGLFVSFIIGDDFKDAKFEVLGQPFHPMELPARYLVEVDGELLQVWRHAVLVDRHDVYDIADENKCPKKNVTKKFEIYKMNWGNIRWEEVKSIGEHALFLGFNNSSLSTSDFPVLKANCIYFTDDYLEHLLTAQQVKRDLGVYNLEDGTIEPCYPGDDDLHLNWPPPIWFIPKGLPCRCQRIKM